MIVVRLDGGGLGNQLFQYAAGRALALRRGTDLVLDARNFGRVVNRRFELDAFAIKASVIPRASGLALEMARWSWRSPRVFREHRPPFLPQVLDLPDGSRLRGFFQSERYFADEAAAIRSDLRLVEGPSAAATALLRRISGVAAVSLHIRRGDYVGNAKFGTLDLDYYRRASRDVAQRSGTPPVLFVFSDEPDWARANLALPYPVEIVDLPGTRPAEHVFLMSRCRHHIIANSSFSWWGAWLNPSPAKIVVAPKRWSADGSFDASTLVPEHWLRL